jgi:hypothetical protein
MQFEAKLTLDGFMTLIAGLIAFTAVIIQIRSSSRQLREQIKTQRDAEREEQERQKKAVATALLFEIDNFYYYHLRGVRGYFEEIVRRRQLLEVVRVPPSLFAVYQGNAARLGDLPDVVVEAIVHFYSKAAQFIALREDYRVEREGHSELAFDHPDNRKATIIFGHLRDSLPGVAKAAYTASEKLCGLTGVAFNVPNIAVAGEDIVVLNRETERIEHEEVHRI